MHIISCASVMYGFFTPFEVLVHAFGDGRHHRDGSMFTMVVVDKKFGTSMTDEMFGRASVWFETSKFKLLEDDDVKHYIQLVPSWWNSSNFHAIEQLNWVLLSTRVLHGRV